MEDKMYNQAILLGRLIGTVEYMLGKIGKLDDKKEEELLQEIYKYLLDLKNITIC